jgi:hypothetical protein
MPDGIRWVGLDVHARESTVAVFDQATGEVSARRGGGRAPELLPWLRGIARPARMVYEAGPTRVWARAPRARCGDRARGVRAEQDRAPAGGSRQDR